MKSSLLLVALLAVSRAMPAPAATDIALWENAGPQVKAEVSDKEGTGTDKDSASPSPTGNDEKKDDSDNSSDKTDSDSTASQTDDSQSDDSQSKTDSQTDDSQSKTDDSQTDDSQSKTDDAQTDDSSDASQTDSDGSESSTTPPNTHIFANNTKTVSVDPNLPAGSVVLNVPTSTANTYVKAGEYATFEWSFTNLIVSPTAVNIVAYCSANMQSYTIATNQSIDNTQAVWNTSDVMASAEVGLMTAQYTLYIYDSNATATSISSAGYLTPLTYIFGLYLPQKYTGWAQSDTYINLGSLLTPPGLMTLFVGALGLSFVGLMV